jgi:hypothetical protein
MVKKVRLWLQGENTGVVFNLDVNDPVCQARAWAIKEHGLDVYLDGDHPKRNKPIEVPEEILNLISPAIGIREQIERSRKMFADSGKFFRNSFIQEEEKKNKKVRQPIKPGSQLDSILQKCQQGLPKEDLNPKIREIIELKGYVLFEENSKYFLSGEILYV